MYCTLVRVCLFVRSALCRRRRTELREAILEAFRCDKAPLIGQIGIGNACIAGSTTGRAWNDRDAVLLSGVEHCKRNQRLDKSNKRCIEK